MSLKWKGLVTHMAYLQVRFFSEVLQIQTEMIVLLPEKMEPTEKLKTLYLFHGLSDDCSIWTRRTSIERYVEDKQIAVIMPSVHLSFYTDTTYGHKYFTFVAEELPMVCRKFFPQLSNRREDNYLAGLSMGGYGAMKVALTYPESYSAVASLSGALDVVSDIQRNHENTPEWSFFFQQIFGDLHKVKNSKHDIEALARDAKAKAKNLPKVFIWCGKQDFLYEDNLNCKEWLQELDYDLTYKDGDGDHSWKYWNEMIEQVLEWLPLEQ